MTWAQLTSLNNAGNEIAGHTLDEYNLKGCTDQGTCTNEVCQDRQNLVNHGFYPVSFAYPFGAYDANAESIVKGCGYTSGRAAGGIDVSGDGAGPVYAETLPPKDIFATRTVYDPPSGNPPNVPPLQLSHMESAITAAAQNGGGNDDSDGGMPGHRDNEDGHARGASRSTKVFRVVHDLSADPQ